MQHEVRGCSRQKTVDFRKCDVDKGNVVVFGQQDSYIENTSTGQRIPTNRRNVVFVMQLKAQTSADSTKMEEGGGVRRIQHEFGFPDAVS